MVSGLRQVTAWLGGQQHQLQGLGERAQLVHFRVDPSFCQELAKALKQPEMHLQFMWACQNKAVVIPAAAQMSATKGVYKTQGGLIKAEACVAQIW